MLTILAVLYVAAVVVGTFHPGPRNWGVHLPGFLPGDLRWLALSLLGAGVVAVAASAGPKAHSATRQSSDRAGGTAPRPKGKKRRAEGRSRGARVPRTVPAWLWLAVLPVYGALLYLLRARTHFLGDGIVWLNGLLGGGTEPFNEPLAAALWHSFGAMTRAMGWPQEAKTFAVLPVACGLAAAAFSWGIVRETFADLRTRWAAWILLLTAGFTQLYFGYIESYPIVSAAVLGTLWLALRHARGADPPWLLGAAFAVTIATHLATLVFLPAYLVAVWQRPGGAALGRVVRLLLPFAVAPLLLTAAGAPPHAWIAPFRVAARAAQGETAAPHLAAPHGILSLEHGVDLANAIALAVPVPALLLLAWAWRRRGRVVPLTASSRVLAAAAIPGLAATAVLNLPVAPAQDWDLTSLFLVPLAAAGVVAARGVLSDARAAAGLAAISAGSLLAFVLVNAIEPAGIARFKTLMSAAAPLTPYGKGYGNSMLSEYYEDRGEHDSALVYAEAALRAEPTNHRYWVRTGTILYSLNRYDEAIPRLEEAIRRGSLRAEARNNLGLSYMRTNRPERAIPEFLAAVASDSTRPDYPQNLGVALFRSGRVDSARAVWTRVLERWPDYPLTRRSMERFRGEAQTAQAPP